MSAGHVVHEPVGGAYLTRATRILLALVALGAVAMIWRFVFGLGAVSNLNDGYPWGIWIALDVVVGTALGCGGYAVALLVYILNQGKYHPLVRPAVLTSLLGYGLAVLAVTVDLGRPWELWKVPVFFWRWTDSPQLEVALCVATYVAGAAGRVVAGASSRAGRRARERAARLRRPGLAFHGPRAALHPRARPAAADHAPVLARHDDAAAGDQAPRAVVHALAALPLPGLLPGHGLRRRGGRGVVLELGLRPSARDRDARQAVEGRDVGHGSSGSRSGSARWRSPASSSSSRAAAASCSWSRSRCTSPR